MVSAVVSSPLMQNHGPSDPRKTKVENLAKNVFGLIKGYNIKLTDEKTSTELTEEQIHNLLADLVIKVAPIEGGYYDVQIQSGIRNATENIGKLTRIETLLSSLKDGTITRKHFLEVTGPTLTVDRCDDDIFSVFGKNILYQNNKREKLRDELNERVAELKIYGVIQSEVSKKLGGKGTLSTNTMGINLLDPTLYGYTSIEQLEKSAEGKFLKKLFGNGLLTKTSTKPHISIQQFLEEPNKESGAFTGVLHKYEYGDNPNPLANFSTMLNDRSRSVSNKVSELTTKLQDITSRYDAAVKALHAFVNKLMEMIRETISRI